MAYKITDQVIGSQPIDETSTTQNHPLGTIVRAVEPTYGEGEFIYLEGVASTIVGSVVEYDTSFESGLASIALNVPRPLAVSMSANVVNQYGWYQISGVAEMAKAAATSFAAGVALGATSGLAVAAASALLVQNAITAASAHGTSLIPTVRVMINRPAGPISD